MHAPVEQIRVAKAQELLVLEPPSALIDSGLSGDDEEGMIWEVVQGLVHQFPVCCIAEYCMDVWVRRKRPALERGIAVFRSFSLAHPNVLEVDRLGAPDIFVPCTKCAKRLGSKVKPLDL